MSLQRIAAVTVLVLVSCPALSLSANDAVIAKSVKGDPKVASINVISFAPGGVLLIGDGKGSQIIAVQTQDTKPGPSMTELSVDDIQKQIAARIGAGADGIEILDLAVNSASGAAYLAIRKQDDKSSLIVTIDGAGEIRELALDEVEYSRVQLSSGEVKISVITDVAWAEDRMIAAGRSNETFASKIFSVAAPLSHNQVSNMFSAETYHVSHRRWETKAPMSVVLPFKDEGKTYVIGAFSCTPVVKYPLDALEPGAEVKGSSVMELGSGNRPIDMFTYEKAGKSFVLSNTFRFHHERRPFGPSPYWTVKFEQNILAEKEDVNETALRRLKSDGKPASESVQMVEAFHGVMHMDKLGNSHAVVLRQKDGKTSLEALPLP